MVPHVLSVSVDLDPLSAYHQIHGLRPPADEIRRAVLLRALPRFLDLFSRYALPATFFVIGQDLDDPAARDQVARALGDSLGHELANHSHTHPYDLARRPREEIKSEIDRCDAALRALGATPRGFRCPGYDMSAPLFDALHEAGYSYDSSLLPSPGYYLAKAAAMLLRPRTQAVLTAPTALLAPTDPYRPDAEQPHRRGQAGVIELPIAVTPRTRVPAIGTSLIVSERLRQYILSAMRPRPFFNLELHGIDLIDAHDDGIDSALVAHQPDLRRPLRDKWRALSATFDTLLAQRRPLLLHEVAEAVQRGGASAFASGGNGR